MTTSGKGFVGQATPRIIDDVYEQCNFMSRQINEVNGLKVGVRLFPGDDTPRTFIRCNLINREVPPGSTIVGGNTALIQYDVVTSTDSIDIDGEIILLENKSNFCYGRYNPDTLQVEYRVVVDEIIQEREK